MPALIATPPLSYGLRLEEEYRVRHVRLGDGYSQRSADGINQICQRWGLVWDMISDADAEAVRQFIRSLGGTANFTWQPPGQSSTLKFIFEGSPILEFNGFNNVTLTATAKQVFDA